MHDLEKLQLAILALSHRIERMEKIRGTTVDLEEARKLAEANGLLAAFDTPRDPVHPGDASRRTMARLLAGLGWSHRRIGAVFYVSELTVRRWLVA